MKTAIGVDIGGTKISMVLGTERGGILAYRQIPTETGRDTRHGVQNLIQNLKVLIEKSGIPRSQMLGIGIGVPGPVNGPKGIVPRSPHLGGWQGIRLRGMIERRLKLPVVMANDANAAALGEQIFGQGRGVENFVYMTISTGIGGGIVVHGKLVEGAAYVGGEVGHMTIVPKGKRCKCGMRGCLEAYASGTAIARLAREAIRKKKAPRRFLRFMAGKPLMAATLGPLAKRGDAFAIHLYREAGYYLGVGIANLLNILNPEKVILGGGVLKSAPPDFWKSMLRNARREAWPQAWQSVKIVRSKLARVGDLGALALVFSKSARPFRPQSE